jgi:antirestriction protein ArdC
MRARQIISEEVKRAEPIVQHFAKFCAEKLKLDHLPEIEVVHDPNFSTQHATFGAYYPGRDMFQVSVAGRHIMDVLRTVAHELVHHKQHEMNSTPDTAKKEYEANLYGSMLIRIFGKHNPEYFQI